MRFLVILMGVVLAGVTGENSTTTTTSAPTTDLAPTTPDLTTPGPTTTTTAPSTPTTTTTAPSTPSTSDPTSPAPTTLSSTTPDPTTPSPKEGDDPSKDNDLSPPAGPRLPRGTVYQIRPIEFGDGSSPDSDPFTALDSIAGIDLAKLKSRPDPDNSPSSKVKVINYGISDSEAVEASEVPKFILAQAREGQLRDFQDQESSERKIPSNKRDPLPSSSQPIPIHTEEGADEPWDASYAFGYTLEDQARHEVSDPDGNIKGYYQYVDDEGYVRKVVYTAGAGKGFVVLNKEKVKGPHAHPRPHPPRKPSHHKVTHNLVTPSYEKEHRPHPHPSQRPIKHRPNYPASPDLDEYDFPESSFRPPPPPPPRQGWGSIAGGSSGSGGGGKGGRRPIYVVKIRKPQHKHGEDGGGDGYYPKEGFPDSSEDLGQWDGDIGNGPVYPKFRPGKGHHPHSKGSGQVQPRPDGAYTFGYETETANRLEKSDNYGNVRGSYSYIDNEGVKRTVHYIAGATTGFQVLGSSPTSSRNVRIEAPPGYVVTRRGTPEPKGSGSIPLADLSTPTFDSTSAPSTSSSSASNLASLATAESEYPNFGPNVIVYHIHPDANSLNLSPWWDALGLSRRPRKMRRVMRVHRKKPRNFGKADQEEEAEDYGQQVFAGTEKETQIQQGPEREDVERESNTEPPRRKSTRPPPPPRGDNLENSVLASEGLSPSVESSSASPPPTTTYLIRARSPSDRSDRDRPRPFRHSTKVNLDNVDMNTFFVRGRRPSHRAYTSKNLVHLGEESSGEQDIRTNPILLGSSQIDSLRLRRRPPVPNPILLKPSSDRISVRSRGARLDVAESNVYAVRSTPSGEEVDLTPPTPNPIDIFAAGDLSGEGRGQIEGEGERSPPREVSTSRSMQLSISSSTTRVPVTFSFNTVEIPVEKVPYPALNSISLSSSSMVHQGQFQGEESPTTPPPSSPTFSIPTTDDEPRPPPSSPSPPRENTLALTDKEYDHTRIMSSSTRLMQRLGGHIHNGPHPQAHGTSK